MKKLHRIFIAINLPKEIKTELLAYKQTWLEFEGIARWTTPENLHLTLAFLQNKSDREVEHIKKLIATEAKNHAPFEISFKHIVYGPSSHNPRMIWAQLQPSPQLLSLQKGIADELSKTNLYTKEQQFSPHITLARFNQLQLRSLEPEELPQIQEPLALSFRVQAIEIMESTLKRGGAEYSVVQQVPL